MRSGGCERSASITTIRSKRLCAIPSSTARDRSGREPQRTAMRSASAASTRELPSPESSSTNRSSHAMPVPANAPVMRSASGRRFAASRNVGTTIETVVGLIVRGNVGRDDDAGDRGHPTLHHLALAIPLGS